MAHTRRRYLLPILEKALTFKGIVGVFGHRQVGKTTLLELMAGRYTTLDRARELESAVSSPEGFLEEMARNREDWPVAIDECQLAPPLFPALKEYVRVRKTPGIFLLSGSVRFSSRKAIREALTGRMLAYELLPFSVSEIQQRKLNTLALDLLSADLRGVAFSTKPRGLAHHADARKYLHVGGLPGILFTRNKRDRSELLESQLNLILDRDLRLVCDTTLPLSRLRVLARLLAEMQNRPMNLSELARRSRISAPTLRKILAGLEAVFWLRQVPCEGDESHPVYFLEDQGEAFHLAGTRYDSVLDLERLAFAHLRIPFAYAPGLAYDLFQYRRQGGAYIPLAFRAKGRVIGFSCSLEESPSLSALRSADSFRKSYPGAKVIHLHPGRKILPLSSDEASLPLEFFL